MVVFREYGRPGVRDGLVVARVAGRRVARVRSAVGAVEPGAHPAERLAPARRAGVLGRRADRLHRLRRRRLGRGRGRAGPAGGNGVGGHPGLGRDAAGAISAPGASDSAAGGGELSRLRLLRGMGTLFDAVARSPAASTVGSRTPSCSQPAWTAAASSAGAPMAACGRCYRGVYAVGHLAPSALADLMAAVLACGDDARASHRSVLHARGVLQGAPAEARGERADAGRAPPEAHRRAPPRVAFAPGDTMIFEGIPMTTRAARAARRRAVARAVRALSRVPRGMGALSRDAAADRGLHRAQPGEARRREAAAGVRRGRDAQRARDGLPAPARSPRLPLPAHEHRPQRRQGRLPLAAARPHHRAAQLWLPRHPLGVRERQRPPPPVAAPRRSRGATCSSAATQTAAELRALLGIERTR